ncbi:hypothetical protein MBT84_47515 [Streptomyces sp. MBT84]|nr:hypothetical protein [Streptomyces sp. MBT84]
MTRNPRSRSPSRRSPQTKRSPDYPSTHPVVKASHRWHPAAPRSRDQVCTTWLTEASAGRPRFAARGYSPLAESLPARTRRRSGPLRRQSILDHCHDGSLPGAEGSPADDLLRPALHQWGYNAGRHGRENPEAEAKVLAWVERNAPAVVGLDSAQRVRKVKWMCAASPRSHKRGRHWTQSVLKGRTVPTSSRSSHASTKPRCARNAEVRSPPALTSALDHFDPVDVPTWSIR